MPAPHFCVGRASSLPVMCCRFAPDLFGPPNALAPNPATALRRIRWTVGKSRHIDADRADKDVTTGVT